MPKTRSLALGLIFASQMALAESAPIADDALAAFPAPALLGESTGMLVLDYAKISLTSGGNFDLFGVHYLQQFNDWLYGGFGFSAPLVEGNFGGFFSADVTLHAQAKVFGNWFVNGGLAFGAGAGGSSIGGIITLSGDGTYFKKYLGFGYDFGNARVGVNLANITIANSPINDTTLNFFVQKPLTRFVGRYSDQGKRLGSADFHLLGQESITSFEFNYLAQINPTGSYTGALGLVSPQLSTFINEDYYYFLGLDLGSGGLIWYNQAQGGLGRRIRLGPKFSLYAQLGVGSGGWVTSAFNTGPGLVVYPKVKLEYMLSRSVGATLSAGYMFAPLGTSRNFSVGAGLALHFPSGAQAQDAANGPGSVKLTGHRTNVFLRRMLNPVANGTPLADMNLLTFQFDQSLGEHWYIPLQIAAATEDYAGFAGYVEGLAGIGWQSKPFASGRLQVYAQLLTGLNDAVANPGPLIYPSAGLIYNIDDRLSVYSQVGRTVSLGQYLGGGSANSFESTTLGLGVSYRFSKPTWARR